MTHPGSKLVLPLTYAHLQLLRAQIAQLHEQGHEVGLLEQIAAGLPGLRAGLSQSERQRLEALDRNDQELQAALDELAEELEASALPDGLCARQALLVDIYELDLVAGRAQRMAEVAGGLALRVRARIKLMGGEAL